MDYFTGCLHLGHEKILSLCGRPFSSLQEMADTYLKNINNTVRPGDVLWILGDLFVDDKDMGYVAEWLSEIECRSIHFLRGDHDPEWKDTQEILGSFGTVEDPIIWRRFREVPSTWFHGIVTLCHWPQLSWRGQAGGSVCLHAHSHGKRGKISQWGKRTIDVGVDVWDGHPVSMEQIVLHLQSQEDPSSVRVHSVRSSHPPSNESAE